MKDGRRAKLVLTALLGSLAAAGCGEVEPRSQWLVHVATDAGFPRVATDLILRVGTQDQMPSDVSAAALAKTTTVRVAGGPQWPLSFGVEPIEGSDVLYVSGALIRQEALTAQGHVSSNAFIMRWGGLPALGDGVTEVVLFLPMTCLGRPADIDEGVDCDPSSGKHVPVDELPTLDEFGPLPEPFGWSGFHRSECTEPPPDGMVCQPGGWFLLGKANASPPQFFSSEPELSVILSPFAIDQREFSVGDYRKLALAQTPGLPEMATHDQRPACHYRGVDDTSADDMPLNCVTREQARDLCALLDKRLPTEAEWEFAAGSDEELELPWGHGEPCEFAVVGRGPTSEVAAELEMPQGNTACLEDDAPASEQGPVALASFEGGVPDGLRDVTESGIAYLGGNLSEWVEDMAVPYWEDCWSVPGTPLYDPVCDTANDEGIVRGGSFVDPPYYARTYARGRASLSGEAAPAVGFRCARSDGL